VFEPLYTAAEMRAAEEGHDVQALMERAGRAIVDCALQHFPDARSFTVVCGAGKNGGDGRIAARLLQEARRDVRVVDAKPEDETKDLGRPDLIVDALFGTGFTGEPRPGGARLIEQMNAADAPVIAVDIPSAVDASTGEVQGAAVRATRTVTFHGRKVGLAVAPGRFHAGRVTVVDIGLEPGETEHRFVRREILHSVPRRRQQQNKYTAGSVLLVGGSRGLTGAACLAAEAALRADAGYVAVAVPESTLPVFEQRLLEVVKVPCPEDEEGRLVPEAFDVVRTRARRATAVALGPGLGRSDGVSRLVRRVLEGIDLPTVVDADALADAPRARARAPLVLTPHEGELAGMLGNDSAWVAAHRLEAARHAAETLGAVVLLKGVDTLVAAPGEGVLVSALGTAALATAGTGDVLTGVIGAFLSKGLEPRVAAAAGAAAQQVASTLVPQQAGMVASDVVAALPRALS
jgi:hydroxyethylthiazole kinase-like uncharacterized protein yjeF